MAKDKDKQHALARAAKLWRESPPPRPQGTATSPPSPPSEMEAKLYYAGLPSGPKLVARSSITPWEPPTGPEEDRKHKGLRPVGSHAPRLKEVWGGEDSLGRKVYAFLDSKNVKWTSMDIVRIGYEGEYYAPVVLWIGVNPESLSGEEGVEVVIKCREILEEFGITDVEVEIRESVVWPRW
ncbi:hypothetical protein BD410DRAFT_793077 [Rickenella mellea]|uniref:Uncharacterized protein n=1 Tax=Rickenella mellea TaxID=50990 RepID=A0A4Y7PTE2_9AGAM|nr:hypothetical protein BD410DRAFT_793077 [Rickenella mellea]